MKLNGLKCKEMVVSFLRQSDNNTPSYINDQQLELVTSFKSLGVTINNQLKWNDNVAIIVKKASKRLYILRVLRRSGIPSADLLSIYNALIRFVLKYACEVWHTNLPQYLSTCRNVLCTLSLIMRKPYLSVVVLALTIEGIQYVRIPFIRLLSLARNCTTCCRQLAETSMNGV